MKRAGSRRTWLTAIAVLFLVAGCGRKGTFEKAGKKADEAVQKAADTASRVGQEVKEGAKKVGDVVNETAGNVQREVHRGNPLPAPTPTRPAGPRKPIKY
jgi:predicted small lipoprotein YifL